MHYWTYCN